MYEIHKKCTLDIETKINHLDFYDCIESPFVVEKNLKCPELISEYKFCVLFSWYI